MHGFLFFLSLALLFFSLGLYFFLAIHKKVTPHPFSWFIWTLSTGIVAAAQFYSRGGDGAYVTFFASFGCLSIAALSFNNFEDVDVSKKDIFVLGVAILSCILWNLTASPLYAVVLITVADILGYYSTVKKAYHKPYSESALYYYLAGGKYIPALFILDVVSVTTILFPISMILVNGGVGFLISIRRFSLENKQALSPS